MAKKVAKNEKNMKISRFCHLILLKFKMNQQNEISDQQQPQTFNTSHFFGQIGHLVHQKWHFFGQNLNF